MEEIPIMHRLPPTIIRLVALTYRDPKKLQ